MVDGEDHSRLDPALAAAEIEIPGGGALGVPARGVSLWPEAEYQRVVEALVGWADEMKRRDFLHTLSRAAAVAAAVPLFSGLDPDEQERVALAIEAPGRVDGAVIDHIEEVLWRCRRQDDALGPQAVLDAVLAQRSLVLALLAETPAGLRPRLLSLFSDLSGFSGWLAFDLNDFVSAQHYYEESRRIAHEAGNAELGAFALCKMSYLATWRGMARVGIDHAVAARAWARRTDDLCLRANAADLAARAYAMDDQHRACMRELEAARSELSASAEQGQSSRLLHFLNEGLIACTESGCLLRLGDRRRATMAARQALVLIDSPFVRNRAMATIHLGVAHLRDGSIDEAAKVIGDAAFLATRNRSVRLGDRLRAARVEMRPWQGTQAVIELDERLATYGLA